MQAKQPPAIHKKAHLVFAVGVLREEFLAQLSALGVVGPQADGIHGLVAAIGLHLGNLGAVGRQDLLLAAGGIQFAVGGPLQEADAALAELLGHDGRIGGVQRRQRRIVAFAHSAVDRELAHESALSRYANLGREPGVKR